MRLEFVNHASYILDASKQGVRLLTDPWLEGNAFNNGWGLLAKTTFRYEDFGSITHLWFSHEHPDHFSPPNLKKIPEDARKKITVLFQKTATARWSSSAASWASRRWRSCRPIGSCRWRRGSRCCAGRPRGTRTRGCICAPPRAAC